MNDSDIDAAIVALTRISGVPLEIWHRKRRHRHSGHDTSEDFWRLPRGPTNVYDETEPRPRNDH
jgi:hypothetical protein